ncbi:LysE family translocator [Azohydromonas lata]|uniref:LysE family translocator n=1 Tax=Azohydromonas lata TaxID=45677 RepID=A0ABU5IJS5_9BURK|nr:LysE family translocator [Azohydromonas lata]MDZ5459150.1 LysE family translocator [Azohydromonas lata]
MDTLLLPSTPLLFAFLGASLVLALTPGPAVVYILTRTLAQGRASGLASVAGVALGNLGNAAGAALGLAALFAVSAAAFTVVKWLGAAYLIYLGLRLWRQGDATAGAPQVRAQSHRRVFADGFVVALLNPKTALFFAAFLPQFMNPQGAVLPQSLLLGGLFVAVAASTDLLYVLGASVLAPRLQRGVAQARWGRRIAGSSFIALGLLTAFSDRPRA